MRRPRETVPTNLEMVRGQAIATVERTQYRSGVDVWRREESRMKLAPGSDARVGGQSAITYSKRRPAQHSWLRYIYLDRRSHSIVVIQNLEIFSQSLKSLSTSTMLETLCHSAVHPF